MNSAYSAGLLSCWGPNPMLPSVISADQQHLFCHGEMKGPCIFLGSTSCSRQWVVYCQTPAAAPFSLCGCPAQRPSPREVWWDWEVFHQLCPEAICSWSWKSELKQSSQLCKTALFSGFVMWVLGSQFPFIFPCSSLPTLSYPSPTSVVVQPGTGCNYLSRTATKSEGCD